MASGRIKGITIELGADASKFTKALAEVDKSLSKTQQNLRDINKALKLDPGNTALLKDKQVELANAIEDTKKKLETEKQALEKMKNTEGFDANSRAARDLQTQIDLDTAALKDLEAQARQASSVLGTQMQVAGQKIQEVGEKIKGVGDSLANIGQTLTTRVTVPIATAFAGIIKTTADFDSQMSKVQAISGATGDQFGQLTEKAREMGEKTKYSATEAGQGFEYMAMAGWKTEDMLQGIDGIMNLAAASGEELGTTSDIVTDALTAFGMEAKDAGRFADILASAATNANTNVSMMGESFKYVAPVAGALGYSAEDVAIALGLMANSGIKADMAGTSLRNMFQRMAKPTKESQAAMDRLNLSLADTEGNMYSFREIMDQLRESFSEINMTAEEYDQILDNLDAQLADGTLTQKKYDAALEELNRQTFGAEGAEKARAAAMLGGTRAMSGLLAIANASEKEYNDLAHAIDTSSDSFARLADGSVVPLNEALASGAEIIETYNGQAEAMAAVMQDNLTGDITILKSKLQELAISLGTLLMPKIREIVDKIKEFVDKLNALDDAQKKQIMKIAAIVAAVGPALLIIGKLVSGFGSLIMIGGKLVSGAGSLLTAISGASGAAGGFSGVIAALSGPIGIAIAAVAALAAGFAYLYNTNDSFRASINETVETLKTNLAGAFEKLKPALAELKAAFDKLMELLSPLFELIFTFIAGVVNGIAEAAGPIIEMVTNVILLITNIIQAFIALINGDFETFRALTLEALQNFWDMILAFLQAQIAFVQGFLQMFGINLQTLTTTVLTAIRTIVTNILTSIKLVIQNILTAAKTLISNILTQIKEKFEEIFDKVRTAVQERIENVKTVIIEGLEAAADYIRSLPEKFYNWGADMVQGIIDGIQSKIDAVRAKIEELASLISSYIHFSEPDVGPLSDFHTYMPDMMDMLVNGINQGLPRVAEAMNGLAQSMVPQVNGQLGMAGNLTNTFNINVYGAPGQNMSELADVIEQRITENVMRRGVAFGG